MINYRIFLGLILMAALTCPPLAEADRISFPPGLVVGTITGPSGEQLTRALRKYESGGPPRATLGGKLGWSQSVVTERETVPVDQPSGQAYELYKPDPFTAKLWLTEETPTKSGLESYELQRFTGSVVFDWQLEGVEKEQKGQATIEVDQIYGGYLAKKGLALSLSQARAGKDELKKRLVKELVLLLLLDLGRHPAAGEIENGSDPLSHQARKLAVSGNWEGARKLWLELLNQNPSYGPPLFNLGLYYELHQQPREAWRYYRAAFSSKATDKRRATLARLTKTLSQAKRLPTRED